LGGCFFLERPEPLPSACYDWTRPCPARENARRERDAEKVSPFEIAAVYAVALGTGWLIGAIGVGGVLLVPALVLLGGLDVDVATPVATLSFLFTGLVGTIAYSRHGRLERPLMFWLAVGVVPGAVAGAATNVALAPEALTIAIAVVLALAAARSLLRTDGARETDRAALPAPIALTGIGGVVGFGSALTGTGGPVLLIPIMMLAGTSALTAIAAGQPIQIPIAAAATIGFFALGDVDWRLGVGLGLVQGLGTVGGARFSHRAPVDVLRRLVTVALAASAIIFVGKAVAS
jgi:uncharacterized membrane protein YfcA